MGKDAGISHELQSNESTPNSLTLLLSWFAFWQQLALVIVVEIALK